MGTAVELELSRFGHDDCYFQGLAKELMPKRDYMAAFLKEAGLKPVLPEGGYFMIADYSKLGEPAGAIFYGFPSQNLNLTL